MRLRFPIFLLTFMFLLSAGATYGQTFSAQLVGGFNLSQIDGDLLGGFNKFGFNAGARVSARLTDRWSLSTEFLFSQQGANRVLSDDVSSRYDRIHLNNVEVPVMVNFADWKILASAGLSYNRIINYEVIGIDGANITDLEDYRTDIPGFVLGATYKFSEKLAFNFRWSRYLTTLRPSDDDPNTEDVNFIGRNISFRTYFYL